MIVDKYTDFYINGRFYVICRQFFEIKTFDSIISLYEKKNRIN